MIIYNNKNVYLVKDMNVGLVIMASGLGKRFGGNKLMEIVDGKPLVKWVLDTTEGLFVKRVVVTRHKDVKDLCDSQNIDCILHDFPNRNDTVRLGLSFLMEDVDYCFFALGDQPLIKRESFVRFIEEAKKNNSFITRASFGDTMGAPVGFPKSLFDGLLNLPEGKGGNYLVKENPLLVQKVDVANGYELFDIDTVSDIEIMKKYIEPA